MVKLILNTPDIFSGGTPVEKIFELTPIDYQGKTIKQIFAEHAFREALQGQESEAANQALQLVFTLIQPKDIQDVGSWWESPFEALVSDTEKVTLDMEFSEAGLEFINNVL